MLAVMDLNAKVVRAHSISEKLIMKCDACLAAVLMSFVMNVLKIDVLPVLIT